MVATDTPTPWTNRIVAHGEASPGDLVPNPENWRLHSDAQKGALAGVLGDVGLVQSVVVNRTTGHLVDGHLRVELAIAEGQPSVPVVYVELSEREERLVLASLDPITAMASADREKLAELLTSIDSDDDALRGLLEAIARQERVELPPGVGAVDPEEVPEPPAEPVARLGETWRLGAHRLACGDSTDPATVERLMAGERAVGMFTDPPYLTNYRADNHPQSFANRPETKDKHWDDYIDYESSVAFYRDFLRVALDRALWERPVIYQWFGTLRAPIVFAAWAEVDLLSHWVVVWHKSRPVLGRVDFLLDYECAMYGWVKGKRPTRDRRPPANTTGVWEISSAIEDGRPEHPCPKPLSSVTRPITWHTKPRELLYEPFCGSGTAIIAAEQTGRRCYAIELSPAFVDVAIVRWERFTGEKAEVIDRG